MKLTIRETEVVRLVADGMTNKEIGAVMGIRADTVNEHVCNLYKKCGCNNRVLLTLWWMQQQSEPHKLLQEIHTAVSTYLYEHDSIAFDVPEGWMERAEALLGPSKEHRSDRFNGVYLSGRAL